ncbi:hypothetical protein EVAR_37115_1 [Eumeta japonica]|uniref:Uncharacterized protein n=1 Tax=Eumeta variegata TaxID=151549 RepID=A0A4C1XSW2_EUMVA|nr:hypothetical protein EVAR_37115_1 [Eumeta japonica]
MNSAAPLSPDLEKRAIGFEGAFGRTALFVLRAVAALARLSHRNLKRPLRLTLSRRETQIKVLQKQCHRTSGYLTIFLNNLQFGTLNYVKFYFVKENRTSGETTYSSVFINVGPRASGYKPPARARCPGLLMAVVFTAKTTSGAYLPSYY